MTTGEWHTCARRSDGHVWCWGYNGQEALGQWSSGNKVTPAAAGVIYGWQAVGAGKGHNCAVASDGTLWCWGANGSGQLGDGTKTGERVPNQISTTTDWTAISGGGDHTCALRTGSADRNLDGMR